MILSLLFLKMALAGTAQINNIVQFGGSPNVTNPGLVLPATALGSNTVISLSANCGVSSCPTNNFLMLSRWSSTGSSGQYQVSSGKTFRAFGIYNTSGIAQAPFVVGYGTAALGSDNTGTAPTGAVYYSSGALVPGSSTGAANVWTFFPMYFEFPALAFPFVRVLSNNADSFLVVGVEQ